MDDEGMFHEAAPLTSLLRSLSLMMMYCRDWQKNEELAVDLAATRENLDQERAETTRLKEELCLLSTSSKGSKLKDELRRISLSRFPRAV